MFEVKISAANAEELVVQIDALRAAVVGSSMPAPVVEEPAKPAPKKSTKGQSAKQDTEVTSEQAGTQESGSPTSDTGQTATTDASPSEPEPANDVDYSDVQKAVVALHQAKGREKVLEVLGTFGVDHGTKLKADQWPAAVEALRKAA